VKKIILTNVVELKLLRTVKIYPVVNINRIRRYREQIPGQKKQPALLIIIEEKKEYEVEKVINKRKKYSKWEYLPCDYNNSEYENNGL